MFNREEEENYLTIADNRISNMEGKIQLLIEQLNVLRVKGDDTKVALGLLAIADDILITFKEFRSQVLERLRTGGNP